MLVNGERIHAGDQRRKVSYDLGHEGNLPIELLACSPQEALPKDNPTLSLLNEEDGDKLRRGCHNHFCGGF